MSRTRQFVTTLFTLLLQFLLFDDVTAGEYCNNFNYCAYGCCGHYRTECCVNVVAIAVGCSVGFAVFLFVLILVCCICRRRRYNGVVYQQNQPGAMVIQSSTMTAQNGVVTTSGVQPGYVYPTVNYGQPAHGQPGYGQPVGYPQQGPYPAYAAPPPSYQDVSAAHNSVPQPTGGVENAGYNAK